MKQTLFSRPFTWLWLMLLALSINARAQQIIVNEFYRGGNLTTTDEFIEVLLLQDLTASQLESFYIGDATGTKASKFSAYKLTNMSAIASTFRAGTLITIGGSGAITPDVTYNPVGGDWNLSFVGGGANAPNANAGNSGDIAGDDIIWVDTTPTGATISANGFAVDIGTGSETGAFVPAAAVNFGIIGNNTGVALNSTNLAGATNVANWTTGIAIGSVTKGQPNGGNNTTFINSLRNGSASSPSLSATPVSLTGINGLSYIEGGGPATAPVSVSGTNFTVASGNVTASSSTTAFTVSPTSAAFSNSALSATSFTVGLVANLTAGVYSGTITFEGGGATAVLPVSGTVIAANQPLLSVNPTTLSGIATPQGTASAERSYTITTANLSNDVTVTASSNVQISTTSGSGFGGQLTIPVATTSAVVYVRITDGAPVGPFSGTITNVSGSLSANVAVTGTVSSTGGTRIREVQGAGHISPLVGQSVTGVSGIVTVIRSNGFWMQDPNPDNNDNTSEGIFVFTSSAPTVSVGDAVQVNASVQELRLNANNLSSTQLTSPSVTFVSAGNSLPVPVVISSQPGSGGRVIPTSIISNDYPANGDVEQSVFDPAEDGLDFFETLEGMRVQINSPVTSGFRNNNGELFVVADNGAGATGFNSRKTITISGTNTTNITAAISNSDFNPERIQIDDVLYGTGNTPNVDPGSILSTIVGVVSYDFQSYEILPSVAPTVVTPANNPKEVSPLVPTTNQLTVASFNVENLAGNEAQAKYDGLAAAIVTNLRSPDIIALEEIQDNNGETNDGTVDATTTLNRLVTAIASANGPIYQYRQINPVNGQDGGAPGGNIRVGFLFNPARVSFVDRPGGGPTVNTTVSNVGGQPRISASPGRILDTNPGESDPYPGDDFTATRKPLVGEFTFNGQTIFAIVNHFSSRGGSGPLTGRIQPPAQGDQERREEQGKIVNAFVDQLLAVNPNTNVVVLGDFNEFQFFPAIQYLTGNVNGETPVLTNLIETLPVQERYTYIFDGNAQALDYILASNALNTKLDAFDAVHINAEYLTQLSDHDPSVARFNFAAAPTALTLVASANPSTILTTGTTTLSATVTGGTTPYSYTFNGPGTITPSGNTASVSGLTAGVQTFTVVASDATTPTSQTISTTVSVTVNAACVQSVTNVNTGATFCTIQEAIDAPATINGHTIRVGAGTYAEAVTVNKSVTLVGANANVAGTGTRGAESIIDGGGVRTGIAISAANVAVNGFRITGGNGIYGSGIAFTGQFSGVSIANNVVTDNVIGVAEPSANASISNNLFDGNNRAGASGGAAIYTDIATNGLVVTNNVFRNHTQNSPVIFAATVTNTHQNLTFTENTIESSNVAAGSMVFVTSVNTGTFARNTLNGSGIRSLKLAGANNGISVVNNFISFSPSLTGVTVSNDGLGGNTNVVINNNSFVGSLGTSIDNQESTSVNAECNFLGSSLVSGNVDTTPSLINNTDNEPGTVGFQPVPNACTTLLGVTLTASPDQFFTNQSTTLTATVSGGTSAFSYTFSGPGTISQTSNSSTATVSSLTAGVQTFTVLVSDASSQTATATVSVTVTTANGAPVAPSVGPQSATVGTAFSFTVPAFTDPNGDALTYTAAGLPADLTFDSGTRVISGTPSTTVGSPFSVSITATDPGSLSAQVVFTITVSNSVTPSLTVTPTSLSNFTTTQGIASATQSVTVSGANLSPSSYSATVSAGYEISLAGPPSYSSQFSFSNLPNPFNSEILVRIAATAPVGPLSGTLLITGSNSTSAVVTLSGTVSQTVAQNDAPVAPSVAPQSATVGTAFSFTVPAFTDPNNDVLTYTATGLPANGLSFDAGSRVISGTPSTSGVVSVTVTATDPGNLSASVGFAITISPASSTTAPPVSGSCGSPAGTIGQPLALVAPTYNCQTGMIQFNTIGGDGSPIFYSAVGITGPTTSCSAMVDFAVAQDIRDQKPSVQPFTLFATQGNVTVSFSWNALAACAPVGSGNTSPIVVNPVGPQSATVGVPYTLNVGNVFSDQETPGQLMLSASGLPASLNLIGNTITGTPAIAGVSTVTLMATDPGNLTTTTSFSITVSPAVSNTGVGGPLSATVVSYNCQTGAITFGSLGGNGSAVEYFAIGITGWTSTPNQVIEAGLRADPKPVTVRVRQSGMEGQAFVFDFGAFCANPGGNAAPVAPSVGAQSATVGTAFSFVVPAFTDPNGDALTYTATGLPANGLSFEAGSRTISGTPSTSGVVNVTITATDPGNLSASTSFVITIGPAGGTPPVGGPLSATVLSYNCPTGAITFGSVGGNGSTVEFFAIGITGWTTNPSQTIEAGLRADPKPVTIRVRQSGIEGTSFVFDFGAFCANPTRVARETANELNVTVFGNPITGSTVDFEISGAEGQPVNVLILNEQGRIINQAALKASSSPIRQQMTLGAGGGVYLIKLSTNTQVKTVKLIKQ